MKTAYLSLGTNLGDRLQNLTDAVQMLNASDEISVVRVSSVYQTDPVGYEDQDVFFNIALEIETSLSPDELLQRCLAIELELGRVRLFKWGPRLIDIDLLLYENVEMDTEKLKIPHPYMKERAFVMIPLQEIAEAIAAEYWQDDLIAGQTVLKTDFRIEQ